MIVIITTLLKSIGQKLNKNISKKDHAYLINKACSYFLAKRTMQQAKRNVNKTKRTVPKANRAVQNACQIEPCNWFWSMSPPPPPA